MHVRALGAHMHASRAPVKLWRRFVSNCWRWTMLSLTCLPRIKVSLTCVRCDIPYIHTA